MRDSAGNSEKLIETFLTISRQQNEKHTEEIQRVSNKIRENTDCVREMLTELTKNTVRVDNMAEGIKNMCQDQNRQKELISSHANRLTKIETMIDANSKRGDDLRIADKEHNSVVRDENKGKWSLAIGLGSMAVGFIAVLANVFSGNNS